MDETDPAAGLAIATEREAAWYEQGKRDAVNAADPRIAAARQIVDGVHPEADRVLPSHILIKWYFELLRAARGLLAVIDGVAPEQSAGQPADGPRALTEDTSFPGVTRSSLPPLVTPESVQFVTCAEHGKSLLAWDCYWGVYYVVCQEPHSPATENHLVRYV